MNMPSSRSEAGDVMDTLDRITQTPGVMGGKPCIRGMRVTVGQIAGGGAALTTYGLILIIIP